ncbi:CD3337/EF1877 family mobilome membrane protein [Liquorilactobacillus mali]|uniref:CD3337/EF1877 family mobilome membrane protein n=1 Tax=Liquorilactobacillus mali TaxID=1618 RepID=UPI0039EC3389
MKNKFKTFGLVSGTTLISLLICKISVLAATSSSIKDILAGYDMKKILSTLDSFNPYMEKAGLTDVTLKAITALTGFFWEINRFVFKIFDFSLQMMFGATSINNGINTLIDKISNLSGQLWDSLFGKFGIILFVISILSAFYVFAFKNERDGLKRMFLTIVIVGFSAVWFKNSSYMLQTFNSISTTAQSSLMTLDNSQAVKNADATSIVRKSFFEKSIERPYYLMNYGKTDITNVQKSNENPYEFLSADYDKDTDSISEKVSASNNKYLKESYMYYKILIALMSPLVSISYGIPLFAIGFLNLCVQIFALVLSLILPVMALLSLIPKYSGSLFKGLMDVIMLFFSKACLVLGILAINICQEIVDIIIPPSSYAGYYVNALILWLIMFFGWKNRSYLIKRLSGGRIRLSKEVLQTVNNQKEKFVESVHQANDRLENANHFVRSSGGKVASFFSRGTSSNETSADVSEAKKKVDKTKRTPQENVQPNTFIEKLAQKRKQKSAASEQLNPKNEKITEAKETNPSQREIHLKRVVQIDDHFEKGKVSKLPDPAKPKDLKQERKLMVDTRTKQQITGLDEATNQAKKKLEETKIKSDEIQEKIESMRE